MPKLPARFIDIHYHAGVDLYRRRYSTQEAGQRYAEYEGWVVVKSHLGSTAPQAWEARQQGLPVSGSVTLNHINGGLDVRAIEQSVYQHGEDSPTRLVVYLPTLVDARVSRLQRDHFHSRLNEASLGRLRITDDSGHLRPVVWDILRAARDLPVVLATGHANRHEIQEVVEAALKVGLDRLLLTHATHPMCGLTAKDLVSLAELSEVYVEMTALTRVLGYHDEQSFTEMIRSHPRIIYSSDLGQPNQPDIDEWLDISRSWFAEADLNAQDIENLTLRTPRELLAY